MTAVRYFQIAIAISLVWNEEKRARTRQRETIEVALYEKKEWNGME